MYFIYDFFSVVLRDNKKVTGSNLDKIVEQISQELWMSACCYTFCRSLSSNVKTEHINSEI